MRKLFLTLLASLALTGCALNRWSLGPDEPEVVQTVFKKDIELVPLPAGAPMVVAVYGFTDKTGQRRPQSNVASLSTAVTQGAEVFLIKALQDVGAGRWFQVVERVGIDALTRERQIIRQMRDAYEGTNSRPLPPMKFAGIILEGGIVGYDSSVKSGGAAARFLGVGEQTQYSEDIVTVSLRAVSVSTGEVLVSVTVQKNIVSAADSISALKFFNMGTKAFEFETGMTINEPGTYAVKSAVETSVVELIKEGERKGIWRYAEFNTKEK